MEWEKLQAEEHGEYTLKNRNIFYINNSCINISCINISYINNHHINILCIDISRINISYIIFYFLILRKKIPGNALRSF